MNDVLKVLMLNGKAVVDNGELKRVILFLEIHGLEFFALTLGNKTLVKYFV